MCIPPSELASEMSVEWKEYWSFLGRHLDLSSEAGLQALEEHLHKQICRLMDTVSAFNGEWATSFIYLFYLFMPLTTGQYTLLQRVRAAARLRIIG